MIAQGLTNRQIGAQLFIAERTVDTHVSRILAKLGCASRAQVAALVASVAAAG
jgi:two-component system, NarL family, response regulator DevR